MPITTAEQRAVLDEAHRVAGAGSLIPAHKQYIQQRHTYDGQCKAAGLSHMHGLRHRYAQARYEALTGWKAPTAGGPSARALTPAQCALDEAAREIVQRKARGEVAVKSVLGLLLRRDIRPRQIITRELGHARSQITAVYLGR